MRALLLGLGVFLGLGGAQAKCTMDNECPGTEICEEEQCVTDARVEVAVKPAAPAVKAAAPAPAPDQPTPMQRYERRSVALMVTGIVATSIGPLLLTLAAFVPNNCSPDFPGYDPETCEPPDTTALSLVGLGMTVGGITMIAVGAQRVPATTATIAPWVAPSAGGLNVRLQL
jgi:hypothetical protein